MASAKFGELIMNNLPNILGQLTPAMFDTKIVSAFATDDNRHNQPSRLATFDSIHDFKTFGTNPVDTIEYSRGTQAYNINRCFFNFNRIMCRGEAVISTENSYLTKPKGQDPVTQGAYDNKPIPITSIANVEDYFCLLNLYRIANNNANDLYIIKGTPKADPRNPMHAENYTTITNLIKNRGWSDNEPNGVSYINTVTDVSPVFRKYYISPNKNTSETNGGGVQYRSLVTQENANDPAGSLGKDLLSNAFGPNNVCIEKIGQSRTYEPTNINSFFKPTLGGINNLEIKTDIQFNIELTLDDTSTTSPTLPPEISIIPYSKSGAANPNERTVINKNVNAMFTNIKEKSMCVTGDVCTSLIGRDNVTHDNATRFYADPTVASFSNQPKQKQIARAFTRKRLGDVLLASVCRLINSNYTTDAINDESKRIQFNTLADQNATVIPRSAIFIGEDRMIIAFCLINKIPCIYDNKNYTIVYLPTRQNNAYTIYANMSGKEKRSSGEAISSEEKRPRMQLGGTLLTRSKYNELYLNTMWNEPYYLYKYLYLVAHQSSPQNSRRLTFMLRTIDRNIITRLSVGNVFNLNNNNQTIGPMYYVCNNVAISTVDTSPSVVAQQIVDTIGSPLSIYVVGHNNTVLLSVEDAIVQQSGKQVAIKKVTMYNPQIVIDVMPSTFLSMPIFAGMEYNLGDNPYDTYANDALLGGSSAKGLNNQTNVYKSSSYKSSPSYKSSSSYKTSPSYKTNVGILKSYFAILNKYEVYSIIDETSEADFYDINDSGVVVAFDCFFYILFNNLVNDFKNRANTTSYEFLIYYLFTYHNNLYVSFDEIVLRATNNKIKLNDKMLNRLKTDTSIKGSIAYFNDLFEKSLMKRDEINKQMRDLFMSNQYVKQYDCAIDNKFTHYGFTTIKDEFEDIINSPIQKVAVPQKAQSLQKVTLFPTTPPVNAFATVNPRAIKTYGGVKRAGSFIKTTHKIRAHRRKRSNKKKRGTHNKSHKNNSNNKTRKKHTKKKVKKGKGKHLQ